MLLSVFIQAAAKYTYLREEYDVHPWEVDSLSVANAFQQMSDSLWHLRRAMEGEDD